MCRVLVAVQLIEETLESTVEVGAYRRLGPERLVERAELVRGIELVLQHVARFIGDAIGYFHELAQPLLKLIALVLGQRARWPAVHKREVSSVIVEPLAGENVVQYYQPSESRSDLPLRNEGNQTSVRVVPPL